MANMSDYLEGQIRAHIFRAATFAKPGAIGISLHTSAGTETTASWVATEVPNAGSYARVSRGAADANWTAGSATDGIISNTSAITFPAPLSAWGLPVSHIGVWDSVAYGGGNLLFWAALPVPKNINNGDAPPSFAAGTLVITFN